MAPAEWTADANPLQEEACEDSVQSGAPSAAAAEPRSRAAPVAPAPEEASIDAGRPQCSDEEAERLGLGTLAFLALVGVLCFLVPRLGGWESSLIGVSHYVCAVGAACVLVAGYTYMMGRPSSEDADRPGSRDAWGSGGEDVAGVPETDMTAVGGLAGGASEDLRKRQLLMTPRMQPAEPTERDPMWDADWANLAMAKLMSQHLQQQQQARQVEVFELNDTPTWLARLQQRREQALRAGKHKLVQKIDKEIVDAKRAHAVAAQSAQEARGPTGAWSDSAAATVSQAKNGSHAEPGDGAAGTAPTVEANRQASDDVYGLDWAAFTTEQPSPQTAAEA